MKHAFSLEIFENILILNLIKIRPVGAEFFHADRRTDGQTDITNLIVALRNFANGFKNLSCMRCCDIVT